MIAKRMSSSSKDGSKEGRKVKKTKKARARKKITG